MMSKKWIAVMLVICIGLGAGVFYLRGGADRQGPEITCTEQAATEYDPDMSDTELLEGIVATDNRDGDVSDSLAVESVYEVDDSNVVVTYVAKDSSNNITKFRRNMSADPDKMKKSNEEQKDKKSDRKSETDSNEGTETEPTPVPVENIETAADAEPTADSQQSETELTPAPTAEPTATDIASQTAAEQEKKADEMPAQSPKIYLNEYYVTTSVGSTVDLLSNVKEIQDDKDNSNDLWHRIQISGTVNTAAAGTYTCTYYVIDSDGNMSNSAELTVVVQ